MNQITITDDNFKEEVLDSELPVLLDLWAPWCGPCKAIAPVVEELSKKYEGRLRVCKLDIDDNQDTPVKYGVRSIPTLLFFKNGELKGSIIGAVQQKSIEEKILSIL